jgi:predicted naringenin-chalcone synthase
MPEGYSAAMATGKQVVLVAATATKVADNPDSDSIQSALITNGTAAVLYVGGSNVTNAVYGAQIAAGAQLNFPIGSEDDLWVYSVGGGTISVLTSP